MDKNIHIPINDTHLQLQIKLHIVLQIKECCIIPSLVHDPLVQYESYTHICMQM